MPSSPTLVQRLDTHAPDWFDLAERINAAMLGNTFAMDNSGTAKEHVGRNYAGAARK